MFAAVGRLIPAFLLFASAAVVLGISAWIQSGLYTYIPEIVLAIVVSSITIAFEVIWGVWRLFSSGKMTSLGVETAGIAIIWVLWLSTAAAWTAQVSDGLRLCQNRPAWSSPSLRATLAACVYVQSLTAFMWIAWIVATFTLIWTIWYATSRSSWNASFRDRRNAAPRGFNNDKMRPLGSSSSAAGLQGQGQGYNAGPVNNTV